MRQKQNLDCYKEWKVVFIPKKHLHQPHSIAAYKIQGVTLANCYSDTTKKSRLLNKWNIFNSNTDLMYFAVNIERNQLT